jgi:hypothetical protein
MLNELESPITHHTKLTQYINAEISPTSYRNQFQRKSIIYETTTQTQTKPVSPINTERKIFNRVIFMAYVFVFDINKQNTFDKCLKYAKVIKNDLMKKYDHNSNKCPLIVFIANKYNKFITRDMFYNKNNVILNEKKMNFINNDKCLSQCVRSLVNERVFNSKDDAVNNMYVVNCGSGCCVKETFYTVFERIVNERRNLWSCRIMEGKCRNSIESLINDKRKEIKDMKMKREEKFIDKILYWCCGSRKDKWKTNTINEDEDYYTCENNDAFERSMIKVKQIRERKYYDDNKDYLDRSLGSIEEEEISEEDGKVVITDPDKKKDM